MILIDTGPLVALIDKADKDNHEKVTALFKLQETPPLTTWQCLTEAMYFLLEKRGWEGQKTLLTFVTRGAIEVHDAKKEDVERIIELMEKYYDRPMDFADASLVFLAENRGLKQILTLDLSDFRIYRINGRDSFEIIE